MQADLAVLLPRQRCLLVRIAVGSENGRGVAVPLLSDEQRHDVDAMFRLGFVRMFTNTEGATFGQATRKAKAFLEHHRLGLVE